MRTLFDSTSESGRAEAIAGHSNADFESMGLPSYQHFRPSTRRQDQYADEFDRITSLHCCFACADGVQNDGMAAIQAAKAIDRNCSVIEHLMKQTIWEVQEGRIHRPESLFRIGSHWVENVAGTWVFGRSPRLYRRLIHVHRAGLSCLIATSKR